MKGPNILTILKAMGDPDRRGFKLSDQKPGKDKPNCYECVYRKGVPGDAHSECSNKEADVIGYSYGAKQGWFTWPYNFDPTWLVSCNGFEGK
jgi:hypothetical protein